MSKRDAIKMLERAGAVVVRMSKHIIFQRNGLTFALSHGNWVSPGCVAKLKKFCR